VESPVLEQAPGRTCGPVERGAHAGAGLLAGLVTLWGPTLEQPVPEGLHPVGGTHAGAVCEELQPVGKDSQRRSLWRTVSHERDLTLEQGQRVRSPPPEEEGEAEAACDELTTTPIPCPPAPLGGGGRETGVKLSLRRREGWGEGLCKIWFYFSLSYSDVVGNKSIFHQVESALPVMVIGK